VGSVKPPHPSPWHLVLLALATASLLAGLTGALVLLGVSMPTATVRLAGSHGPLMTLGFLGTLIALERAVALDRRWGYLAPLSSGLGGAALVLGLPAGLAAVLLTLAGVLFVAMYVAFDRIERSLHTSVQGLGALAWSGAGLLLLAGRPVTAAIPWLAGFLVLTIAGERLELSRLGRPSERARAAFSTITAVFCAGIVASVLAPDPGVRLAGGGLLGLAIWLARNDLARRTVRPPGVTRFVAVSLLAGYAWLGVAGACWLVFGATGVTGVGAAAAHDTMLHALFLGFVISMVFGHAPIILPAVLRLPLPYHRWFYAHLGLLHASLVLRIVGGDLLGGGVAWRLGGILNVVALLLFLGSSAIAMAYAWSIPSRGDRGGGAARLDRAPVNQLPAAPDGGGATQFI
jgi:hypothetical protein